MDTLFVVMIILSLLRKATGKQYRTVAAGASAEGGPGGSAVLWSGGYVDFIPI